MAFVAVSPFRPVEKPHPLAALPLEDDALRGFEPPSEERIFANAMQIAIGRYSTSRVIRISEETSNNWIRLAQTWKDYATMSATMVVAVQVLRTFVDRPALEDVRQYGRIALEPVLTPETAEAQMADLWRYTQRVLELV